MQQISKELVAASSTPIILAVLSRGESYGYEIIRQVKEASGDKLQFSDGTLYPILRKLEEKRLIVSEWRVAANEKRRRYYQMTEKGNRQISEEKLSWNFMSGLLEKLWKTPQTKLA